MPFAAAKRSHFVGGLGFGSGLARGSCVVGAGSWASEPSGDGWVGRAWRAAINAWMPSRAVDFRYSSRFDLTGRY